MRSQRQIQAATRRMLSFAAAFFMAIGVGGASAQTVVVQHAPSGSNGELVLNGASVAKAAPGADGIITLDAGAGGLQNQQTLDALIWVDDCGGTTRIVIMSRVEQPPASDACRRVAIQGVFFVQRITSMLIDVSAVTPAVRLRQGPLPPEWLLPPVVGAQPRVVFAPRGLILFGGGGFAGAGDLLTPACGNVTGCSSDDRATALTGGIGVWFSPYIGIEASYFRPSTLAASGSGDRFTFDSDVDGGALAFVGKVGIPVGRVRIVGAGGLDYHRATFTTRETIDGTPLTLQWRTEGWAPVFGGGMEAWFTRSFGIYGEFIRLGLKGDDTGSGEARTDTAMMSIIVGGRIRLPIP